MNDYQIIRDLTKEWSKLAKNSIMDERADVWTRLHDLNPIRPAIIVETELMSDFIKPEELMCEDLYLRTIERGLREGIKHVNSLDDDYILLDEFKLDYQLRYENADYGVGLEYIINNDTHAVLSNHPISTVSDIKKLKKRKIEVDFEKSLMTKKYLEEVFDGTINVNLQYANYNLPQLSKFILDLIGMDNMYFWLIDEPNAMAEMVEYIKDDYLSKMRNLEMNNALTLNNKNQISGSGSYGYVSGLNKSIDGKVRMSDLWVWMESQETTTISPELFEDAFLPAMGEISKHFGLVYYGCCEQLHDRFERIEKYMNNIRSVSVSPWSDFVGMGKLLKDKYVFSKKLSPQFICFDDPDIKSQEKEIVLTLESVGNNLVEFIYRDVYEYRNDPMKFQNWINLVRKNIK